jgi:preprotein translocase subunit YajC
VRTIQTTILLIVGAISIFTFVAVQSVKAQQTGVIVSPPVLNQNLTGGTTYDEIIHVSNFKLTDNQFYITTRDMMIDERGNFISVTYPDGDNRSEFEKKGWLTISPNEFFLSSGDSTTFTAHFDLPTDFPTQGYYFEIVISTQKPDSQDGVVGLVTEIVLPVGINYLGKDDIRRFIAIAEFEAANEFGVSSWLYEYPPVEFKTLLQNIGNVNIIPTGEIFISRDENFSNVVTTIPFNQNGLTIFNGSFREFKNVWDGGFLTLDENNRLSVNFDKIDDFRFGRYFAQLNVVWDGQTGKEFERRVVTFWIIPWKLILLILAIVVIITYIIIRIRRKKKKSAAINNKQKNLNV